MSIPQFHVTINPLLQIAQEGYLFHQVNCYDQITPGRFQSIVDAYPAVGEAFHQFSQTHSVEQRYNQLQFVPVNDRLVVCNSYTDIGTPDQQLTNEDALIYNLRTAVAKAASEGHTLAIANHLGCEPGESGNWPYIFNRIQDLELWITEGNFKEYQATDFLR